MAAKFARSVRNTVLFTTLANVKFLIVENHLHIFQYALGLGLDIAGNQAAICWADGDLAGAEQQIANAHGMVVWTDGGG